ncbi:MAG: Ig-like domain-containing protein, partial [Gallionella sp.]|nr:Ig-like domain-containing protein [Gallionella sp.]
ADDLTVVGGTLGTGSFDTETGKIWTATFTANDNLAGTGSVTLANSSYTDAVLNLGVGGTDSVIIDTVNPTATVAISSANLSDNSNSTTVTMTFSEVPAGFVAANDLTVVGGTLGTGSFDTETGKTWTATFTANDNLAGTGSISLVNDSYTDAVLNLGTGGTDSVIIDTVNPTATVAISATDLSDTTNSTTVTITFSEVPTGFDPAADLSLVGGTLDSGNFDAETGKTWTATFTATNNFAGAGSVSLANSSYTDAALNLGAGSADTVVIDTVNPTTTLVITAADLSDTTSNTTVTITFSEVPIGFDAAVDLSLVGGSLGAGSFDQATGRVWTATFTADDNLAGTGSVTLSNSSYTDAVLNLGAGGTDSVIIDTVNPTATVAISATDLSDTNNSTTVTITFSEVPTGFDQANDLTVAGGTLGTGSFDQSGKIWTATFTATDNLAGTGSVTLTNSSYTDAVFNVGAGSSDSVSIDTVNPTVSVVFTASDLSDTTNSTTVTITFSEVPTGFVAADDLTVVGGTLGIGSFDTETGKVWTATFTASDNLAGTGSVTLANSSYTDTVFNLGSGNNDSVTIDTVNPTASVVITASDLSDTTNSTTVTITFSEVPSGFDATADLTVVGGTLGDGSFDQATGKVWTATFTASDNLAGTGSVTLANNSYTDAVFNLGSGNSDSVTIDTVNPTATVVITAGDLSDTTNSTTVTITFSEVPTGFNAADDLTVVGGSLGEGSFDQATGKVWTATFTASDNLAGTGSVTLANSSYTDAVLNLGAGGTDSVIIDTVNPTATVAISAANLSDTNNSTTVTITFSEVPTGFVAADDLTVVGGT